MVCDTKARRGEKERYFKFKFECSLRSEVFTRGEKI